MTTRHFLMLCKTRTDLADLEPLRAALLARFHEVTFIVEAGGSLTNKDLVPAYAHIANSAEEITSRFKQGNIPEVVISPCPKGGMQLLPQLQEHIKHFVILSDARKVSYTKVMQSLEHSCVALLCIDERVVRNNHLSYKVGLPRLDSAVRLTMEECTARRRALRSPSETRINVDDFVVLFVAQQSEAARPLQDVTTALRSIHVVTPDDPIRRVLAILPHPRMNERELVLWTDVLSLQSVATHGVAVLQDITTLHRDILKEEQRRVSKETAYGGAARKPANPHLLNATIVDAVLAADLVISSTSSVLLLAAALGKKALSYYAPGCGMTAFTQEVDSPFLLWNFFPEDDCIRIAKNYNELRDAIASAIPRRKADQSVVHQIWPEETLGRNRNKMHWAQGENTNDCVLAIEDAADRWFSQ
ncbi:MAG: hypothetical protein AAB384_00560 [Patescibacteria group bacterium]